MKSKQSKINSTRRVLVVGLMDSENLGDMIIAECLKSRLENSDCVVSFLHMAARDRKQELSQNLKLNEWHQNDKIIKKTYGLKLLQFMPVSLKALLAWGRHKHQSTRVDWLEKIKNTDLVIVGGGQLITNGSAPRLASVINAAKRNHKPVAIFSVGISSDLDFWTRLLLRHAMKEVIWASARSELSRRILQSLVAPNNECKITPDPAIYSNLQYKDRPASLAKTIGFNIQNLTDLKPWLELQNITESAFENHLIAAIKDVVSMGYKVNLFTNGDPCDQAYAYSIYRRSKFESMDVTCCPRPMTTSELVTLIAQNKLNVCCRLHASIVSYSLGIPFIVFPWDSKVLDVMNVFNQADSVANFNSWQDKIITNRLQEVVLGVGNIPLVPTELYNEVDFHIEYVLSKSGLEKLDELT